MQQQVPPSLTLNPAGRLASAQPALLSATHQVTGRRAPNAAALALEIGEEKKKCASSTRTASSSSGCTSSSSSSSSCIGQKESDNDKTNNNEIKPLINGDTSNSSSSSGAGNNTANGSNATNLTNNGNNVSGANNTACFPNTNPHSSNATKPSSTKPNGLRNRIIQRPPPLILDKVSNFYDNETHSPIHAQSIQHQPPVARHQLPTSEAAKGDGQGASSYNSCSVIPNEVISNSTSQQQQSQYQAQAQVSQNNGVNSANHKFWASLNMNASRTRGHVLGTRHSIDSISCVRDTVDSNTLGPDLIISHRNTGTTASRTTTTVSSRPTEILSSSSPLPPTTQQQVPKGNFSEQQKLVNHKNSNLSDSNETNRPLDMSKDSEPDDSSTHGGGENDGGNLIGVDNPTPPASTGVASEDPNSSLLEPPPSATSSRPRSNNPFLTMDEDLTSSHNFHKRPASFIAATDNALINRSQVAFDQANSLAETQHMVQEQMNNLQLNDLHSRQAQFIQSHQQHESPYYRNNEAVLVNQHVSHDQRDQNSIYEQSIIMHQQQQPSVYGVFGGNYMNYEPTISVDSESAVCKPPPSATMQLPHWTEAIYELNNAILESSSVAGGAENGEFIYIVESGDIILELDHIKVSGYTLVEFNGLLESKPMHLLSAVQTKHSHGLTTDLKHYLNCSFPKNSTDKDLQDLTRENIYRRTIPCTTRRPKDGEVDKIDYHFLSKEQFVEMNNRGMLLECGMYGGHYYGTMKPFSDLNSLSIYGSINQREISDDMLQPLNANHPAVGLAARTDSDIVRRNNDENPPLYENHESLRMHQMQANNNSHAHIIEDFSTGNSAMQLDKSALSMQNNHMIPVMKQSSIVAVDSESLPHGWERVIDQTHGAYYIDHNTQRTQYERPYEIELTKGSMGFGFTLVEAENGVLLVRSVIPGGPAYLSGTIRPGDILISAVGVSVAGLQHTDIAKLFSTFAVGDRVRLTFARSTYVVDANLVPDEYLFSNGTNGDMTVAVNSNYYNYFNQGTTSISQSPHVLTDQEYEFITVTLKRGDQGFGFTIGDSLAGQKVKKIQNVETCTNLRQSDILVSLNNQDITKLTHKEVVERLKNFPVGQDVTITVKRKKRFRSKTPMAMPTENDEYSVENTPQRNCKTPSLGGFMLRRSISGVNNTNNPHENLSRTLFSDPKSQPPVLHSLGYHPSPHLIDPPQMNERPIQSNQMAGNYHILPGEVLDSQSIYGLEPLHNNELYYNSIHPLHMSLPTNSQISSIDSRGLANFRPSSMAASENRDHLTNSVHPSETSLPPIKFADINGLSQINQYNNFMNNDKLVMMQMQQQYQQSMLQQPSTSFVQTSSDYNHIPLYSNSDMLRAESAEIPISSKPINQYLPSEPTYSTNFQTNYYANNEEIALQRVQYGSFSEPMFPSLVNQTNARLSIQSNTSALQKGNGDDEYEYHQVDLDRGNTDSNWGIRLIGGSEVDRAISIGSIVLGGAASKNGQLKSGDEIIFINGINVVGATHQHVVELISTCSNRASLVVRRKKFGEACEVVLTRNKDEGFGFVIISSGNCALIGRIIEGSPAHRCQQLHVKDRIIAVNGRYITPKMQHPEIVNMIKDCGSTLRLRIIPANSYTVELIKNAQNDEFGFTMRGGNECGSFLSPLYIVRVAPNGLARDSLYVGDQIIEINGIPTVGMTHLQAANIIKYSDPIVKLKLRRSPTIPPSLLVDSPRDLQKFNQVTAEMKPVNLNSTPSSFLQEQAGSMSSEPSSGNQQHGLPLDQQQGSQRASGNNSIYNQSMPLYAT